ncbi:hypothetical protein [Nonomuraea sp. NPDC050310]|uniref:hypothetical protein n=1 Tax=Nonomuraea sp. NPDC050310 TaxID=3154935 RepID=UPI0033F38613
MHSAEESLDELENRMGQLRQALRTAMVERDAARASGLRRELRHAETLWQDKAAALGQGEGAVLTAAGPPAVDRAVTALLPTREQVHQVLSLLEVAAAPKLITAVHGAFFPGELPASRLASMRRDEERSYRSAPNARPYYVCPALTADRLAPARALLTVSTWPLERRIVGAHSPRVDFLTATTKIATAIEWFDRRGPHWLADARARADRLLRSFAVSIPGALAPPELSGHAPPLDPRQVAEAAEAELAVHVAVDRAEREQAAAWARQRLPETERLFGTRLQMIRNDASSH